MNMSAKIMKKSLIPRIISKQERRKEKEKRSNYAQRSGENKRAAKPGIMDHPSKKSTLADLKKNYALEKYGSKVIDIVSVLENEDVSNLSTINARNKCAWADLIIVGEGKGSRHPGNLVNGVYKM
ncbi:12399_t:CDS:2, partial [Ambispora leptoticha]